MVGGHPERTVKQVNSPAMFRMVSAECLGRRCEECHRAVSRYPPLIFFSLFLCACNSPDPVPVAGAEMPFFPECVARESGGFQERKYMRLGWFSFGHASEPSIIDADCAAIEP